MTGLTTVTHSNYSKATEQGNNFMYLACISWQLIVLTAINAADTQPHNDPPWAEEADDEVKDMVCTFVPLVDHCLWSLRLYRLHKKCQITMQS